MAVELPEAEFERRRKQLTEWPLLNRTLDGVTRDDLGGTSSNHITVAYVDEDKLAFVLKHLLLKHWLRYQVKVAGDDH